MWTGRSLALRFLCNGAVSKCSKYSWWRCVPFVLFLTLHGALPHGAASLDLWHVPAHSDVILIASFKFPFWPLVVTLLCQTVQLLTFLLSSHLKRNICFCYRSETDCVFIYYACSRNVVPNDSAFLPSQPVIKGNAYLFHRLMRRDQSLQKRRCVSPLSYICGGP
jgi:hypothetical protein